MDKTENFVLENFDGSKAYLGRVKYLVGCYDPDNRKTFALPASSELEDLVDLSVEETEKRFPILKIVKPFYNHEQALAVRATPEERKRIYEELRKIAGDMGLE